MFFFYSLILFLKAKVELGLIKETKLCNKITIWNTTKGENNFGAHKM